MNNEALIIHKLNMLDERTKRMERLGKRTFRQTLPEMPWVIAAACGAVVAFAGWQFYPQLPASIRDTVSPVVADVQNEMYTLGQWYADYTGKVDRSFAIPSGTLTLVSLSPVQSCRWRAALLQRESSGNYQHPGNQWGYFAGYGFGAESLNIVGLTEYPPRGARLGRMPDQSNFLNNPANWKLKGGKPAFLHDNLLQDRAVTLLANLNIKDGFKSRVLLASQQERIAGFAAAAHLKGLTAAISWYARGVDSSDANGTNTSDYAAMGEASINHLSNLCAENTREVPSWLKWLEVKN